MAIHSPLGASGAERWMKCPGSVTFLKTLNLPETDEEDYRTLGTAAHEAAAHCVRQSLEAWEIIGQTFGKHKADEEMSSAIQTYLDVVNPLRDQTKDWWCEFFASARVLHPQMYGTVDFAAKIGKTLHIIDYKHGAGIVVEPEDNPQLKYYTFVMLHYISDVEDVILRIVQPRAWHKDGPVREWHTTAAAIRAWGEEVLIPAMFVAEIDDTLDAGPWCRFCPAKLACPLLHGLFKAAASINPKMLPDTGDEALARDYALWEAVHFYEKAYKQEVMRRLLAGSDKFQSTAKLVYKRADRVWKEGALEVLQSLGPQAYSEPAIKSPAQVERLGEVAKDLVKEWAYMPQTGLTVAAASDRRAGIVRQTVAEKFADAIAAEDGE